MKEILKPSILNTGKILSLFFRLRECLNKHVLMNLVPVLKQSTRPPPVALILYVMALTYSLKLCAHFLTAKASVYVC